MGAALLWEAVGPTPGPEQYIRAILTNSSRVFMWKKISSTLRGKGGAAPEPLQVPSSPKKSPNERDLRRKLGHGTAYPLKIVVRGASGVGKTALVRRLQGKGFSPEYAPTPALEICHAIWPCVWEDDIKAEVWDVVDAESAESHDQAVTESTGEGRNRVGTFSLDPSTIDVYRGCQVALLLCDPKNPGSLEYIKMHLPSVPSTVHVVLLLTFRDRPAEERSAVSIANLKSLAHDRPMTSALEVSSRNCFGLESLSKYFNLPVLNMREEALKEQLRRTQHLKHQVTEMFQTSSNETYESFLQGCASPRSTPASPTQPEAPKNSASLPQASAGGASKRKGSSDLKLSHDTDQISQGTQELKVSNSNTPTQPDTTSVEAEAIAHPSSQAAVAPKTAEDVIDSFHAGDLDDDFFGSDAEDSAPAAQAHSSSSSSSSDSSDSEDRPAMLQDEDFR